MRVKKRSCTILKFFKGMFLTDINSGFNLALLIHGGILLGCGWRCTQICVYHISACGKARGHSPMSFSRSCPFYILKQTLSLAWSLLTWLGFTEPQASCCFSLSPAPRFQAHSTILAFSPGLWGSNFLFMLVCQADRTISLAQKGHNLISSCQYIFSANAM